MNIEINPDFEKSTTLRALSAFLTLLADEAEGETKDQKILSAIVQKGLDHVEAEHEAAHFTAHASLDPDTAVGRAVVIAEGRADGSIVEPAPPKRTRKAPEKKVEPVVEPGNAQAGSAISGSAAAEPAGAASSAASAPTIDDVRAALQRYTAVFGMPDGIALLKNYGAGRISELGVEQYPLFIAECDAVEAA